MNELKSFLRTNGQLYFIPKGEELYRGGDIPGCAFLLISGLVKVYDYDSMGEEFVYAVLSADTLFLGGSTILRRPKKYSYQALTDIAAYKLSFVQIQQLINKKPEIIYKVMSLSADTHSKLAAHVRAYTMLSPTQRVAKLLLDYSNDFGADKDGACVITEKLSVREIAPLIGASSATVSRAVNELGEQSLVRYINGHYWLYDLKKLSELVNCDGKILRINS